MGKIKFLDAIAFLFIAFICGFLFVNISTLVSKEKIQLFSVTSPLIFAVLIACGFAVCLVIVAYKELKSNKKDKKINEVSSRELFGELKVVLIFVCIILIYIFLLKYLKFLLGSTIIMTLGMIFLNTNKDKILMKIGKAAVAAVVTVPVMYYIFHGIFNVMLP